MSPQPSQSSDARYDIEVIRLQFNTGGDYWYARITRRSDGKELARQHARMWLLKRKLRPRSLDRLFAAADRSEAEGNQTLKWSA